VSCPALTTHSELDQEALADAGISPTMIRFAVGDEDPKDLIAHLVDAARLVFDPQVPGFSDGFASADETAGLIRRCYLEAHEAYITSKLGSAV